MAVSDSVESYRTQLTELNALPSPETLFGEIDELLKKYHTLKREYNMDWNKHDMYSTKIKSYVSSKNHRKKSAISIKEVQSFITKIKFLQQSVSECLDEIALLAISNVQTERGAKPKKEKEIMSPSTPNIRPSHVKRYSNDFSTKPIKVKRRKSSRKYSRRKSLEKLPQETTVNVVVTRAEEVFADILASPEVEQRDKPQPSMHLAPQLAPPITASKSMRSFGDLFSKQFQTNVALGYMESIRSEHAGFFLNANKSNHDEKDMDEKEVVYEVTPKQRKIVQYYHDNYYGQNEVFESPFGMRPVIYCDWTASGKVLECVETYLQKEMYTLYANTHTTTSITGIQTSKFRSEARSIILQSMKGHVDEDVVIFAGSGVTGAVYKMANILMKSVGKGYKPETTVVFISIYEHNSNIYIWKELGCKVIVIPENRYNKKKGGLDLKYLEKQLELYTSSTMKRQYNLIIGSFTAASNISGIIAPIDETTLLLHKYGALSFWDYATAGPYLDINMTNKENPMLSKDAVFISTHKYLAGPGAPGILCAKRKLFSNYVPVVPGGGTVFAAFGIKDGEWEYLDNIEEREEGGTPDIIGSVRAAFTFMIKDYLSTHFIEATEKKYLNYFLEETRSCSNLTMMGNLQCDRLPVLSFLITHSQKFGFGNMRVKYLHYNFIAALMNDLFGIQGRGGCACAGMYGLDTLGMVPDEVDHVLSQMRDDQNELARPGYFRINLHYTLTEKELKYIVKAVKFVCEHGWKFLPLYDIDKETGNYFHRDIKRKPDLLKKQLRSLLDISFDKESGEMLWKKKHLRVDGDALSDNLDKFFDLAHGVLDNLHEYLPSEDEFSSENDLNDNIAWYWLPSELYQDARNASNHHY